MVPTSSAAPMGHRRISSFRTSTFNFFKGNSKGSLHSSGSIRRNEITISNPLPYTEENVSPTTASPPSRADTEPTISHRHKFPAVFEIGPSRAVQGINTRGTTSIVGEESDTGEGSITVGMDLRDLSPSRQTQTDTESCTDDKKAASPSSRSKTKGAKLKMALSLLRRRSNNNLRRAFADPVEERYESTDEREPFIEPLMDPDFIDRSNAGSRLSSAPSTVRPQQKSSGFKFAFTARNHNRQVLTKQPPADTRRPRRATVASVVFDPSMSRDPERPRTSVWSTSPRPGSSQSVIPKEEGFMNGDGTPGTPGGGLFPRPASLQRNWSDGPRHHRDASGVSNADSCGGDAPRPASQAPDRGRPVSFAGMLNGYSSMKITEAVSLETRVKELEKEVETLKEFITQNGAIPLRRNFSTVPGSLSDPNCLDVPSFLRSLSISSAGSSDKVDSSEFPSTPKNLNAPPRPEGSLKARASAQKREETLKALEGNREDTKNKRDTSSTIRAPKSTDRSPSPVTPTPTVSIAQYTGLLSLVKREQRARRKAEAQISNLQEQMALVLHRQLLSSSPTDTVHSSNRLRSGFGSIRRKTSSEVPTPDLTPPRTSPTNYHAIPGNLFTGFDSEAGIDESDYENDDESLFIGVDADDNEIWETPAEDRESMIGDDSDSDRIFRETMSAFPSPGGQGNGDTQRTMSLSQLTHKSSLARDR
ncbi:uncharacterized protein LAJ45_08421 [Morchella importuna]|uniref:uncharacterized protein n=1 Tax=Morchella importuna TaxID=1174673 RepID=UPI001E8D7AD6|nr:uncharacterized protein LAJ45_08421 [Morchella importuna]KAH8147593.1 hypothetical protein LAJ45_08421 [Morchella importuna]